MVRVAVAPQEREFFPTDGFRDRLKTGTKNNRMTKSVEIKKKNPINNQNR